MSFPTPIGLEINTLQLREIEVGLELDQGSPHAEALQQFMARLRIAQDTLNGKFNLGYIAQRWLNHPEFDYPVGQAALAALNWRTKMTHEPPSKTPWLQASAASAIATTPCAPQDPKQTPSSEYAPQNND